MKEKMDSLKILGLVFVLVLALSFVFAQEGSSSSDSDVKIHVFYGEGCGHCENALTFLDDASNNYPLQVIKHEVYFDKQGRDLFYNVTSALNKTVEGVPTILVGDKYFVGFSDSIENSIMDEVKYCLSHTCGDPIDSIFNKGGSLVQKLTVPAVIFAAMVDAINPCAFAVLIILMTTVLATKKKRKALLSGLAFAASVFISYFLMGLGLYSAIQVSGISHTFYWIVSILAIVIGLFNLKDYFWYGKFFIMEVPLRWRPKLKSLIKGVTSVPGAFFIGFIISLFLLPCTSGPYIVILGLLSSAATKSYAVSLLLLYNLIFILPMILITLVVSLGITTSEKAEKVRRKNLKVLHLIAGIIILTLSIGMITAMMLGMI